MTARQESEVITLLKIGMKHRKRYSFPSQSRWLALLKAYHSYEISERTLRRDLRELEALKFIETVHRKRIVPGCGRVFTSNLYKLKKKVFIWLRSLEVLAKSLFTHYHRPKLADNKLLKKQVSSRLSLPAIWNVGEKVEMETYERNVGFIRDLISSL